MKVIFLNTWYGELKDELRAYVQKHLETTDVFCFQEAYEKDRKPYADLLESNFTSYDCSKSNPVNNSWFGNVMYVRKGIEVVDVNVLFQHDTEAMRLGLAMYANLRVDGQDILVCNMHGMPYPGHKLDTPARLHQTKTLIEQFCHKKNVLIGGDFNLLPETESVRQFSENGYQNLINDYSIATTRNHLTFDKFPDNIQYHADYVFASPAIHIANFVVPEGVVSDHQPLEVTFSLQQVRPDLSRIADSIISTQPVAL